MTSYNQQPYQGMLSASPNYTYAGSFQQPTPAVSSPQTGMASIADALINGYTNYLTSPKPLKQPTQLGSAGQTGLSGLLGSLFGGSTQPSGPAPVDPSMSAGVY